MRWPCCSERTPAKSLKVSKRFVALLVSGLSTTPLISAPMEAGFGEPVLVPGFDASLTAFADPDGALEVAVVEHLRVQVRSDARAAWLHAESLTWEPWLRQQSGYLGRELRWDAEREEGVLLIRWASREQWKAIPEEEVERVQMRFEVQARRALGNPSQTNEPSRDNPFPLVHASELEPRFLALA